MAYLLGASCSSGFGSFRPYTRSNSGRAMRSHTTATGVRTSVSRSIGITPEANVTLLLSKHYRFTDFCRQGALHSNCSTMIQYKWHTSAVDNMSCTKLMCSPNKNNRSLFPRKLHTKPFAKSACQTITCEGTCCYHFRLGLGVSGQNQSRAIAQGKTVCDVQGLEMLCLAGSRRHCCLLRPKQGIDCGGLANIGVASQPNCHSPIISLQQKQATSKTP